MRSRFTLILLLATLLLPAGVLAAPGPVLDQADVLSADTERRLRTIADEIRSASGKDLLVVTVPRVEGSPQEHSDRLFREHGLDGVLIYVAPEERQLGLVPGQNTESLFPRRETAPIRQRMLAHFAKGDYDAGVLEGARDVQQVFSRGAGTVLGGPDMGEAEAAPAPAPAPAERRGGGFSWAFLLIPLLLGGLVFLLFLGFVFSLVRGLFRRRHAQPAGWGGRHGEGVPGAGPYTRGMGGGPVYGPGYGGGFGSGGGGFWPSVFGGLGGAMAGSALYDWMTPDRPTPTGDVSAPSDLGWQQSDLGGAGGGDFGSWDAGGGGDFGGGGEQW